MRGNFIIFHSKLDTDSHEEVKVLGIMNAQEETVPKSKLRVKTYKGLKLGRNHEKKKQKEKKRLRKNFMFECS